MVEGNCRKANCCQLVMSARIQVSPMTEVSLMLMTTRETLGELAAASPAPWKMGNLSSIKVNSLHWDQSINFSFMLCVLLHKTNCSVMTLWNFWPMSARRPLAWRTNVSRFMSLHLLKRVRKKTISFWSFFLSTAAQKFSFKVLIGQGSS